MPAERQLAPANISRRLFTVSPDRDERASHLAMETLLTLWANDYSAPVHPEQLVTPKRRNGALRSLAVRENFLEGIEGAASPEMTVDRMGEYLARGTDFLGSDGLGLVQAALQSLIDVRTRQGSAGALLLQPFHESLLWYDARKSGAGVKWAVRKVNMRGTGVALARLLLAPPEHLGADLQEMARRAVEGIRDALQAPSPFGDLAERLNVVTPDERTPGTAEPDEQEAWVSAGHERMRPLAERVIRHSLAITAQPHVGSSRKLLQLRNILALDVAWFSLLRSWDATNTRVTRRYLLASYTPEERRSNRVRIYSETSYQSARQKVSQAVIATLGEAMQDIATAKEPDEPWTTFFESRSQLDDVASALEHASGLADFGRAAERAFEQASGGGYGRPGDAFRVLLDSVDLLVGTGQYRYLRAGPDLLGSMVGALSIDLPASVERFLELVFQQWAIVIGEAEAVGTELAGEVEGDELRRNSRFLEDLLVNSGLALGLSDQTFVVGMRRVEAS
jgi:hypothetical protein